MDRLLNNILSQSNSDIESITLERFEDMSEDDLRSIVLIGNGRVRHAYRPESLYSQYVSRRGRVVDPQNPSYTLTQNDLNNVFDQMRQRYPGFKPEIFNEEAPIQRGKFMDNIPLQPNSQDPHPLLSGRNSYLDELEREFNDMVNRQYTKEKRPHEYDKGKGPGGFPMRSNCSSNSGMPAKEPLFEPHLILLYDPDNRYVQSKNQIHSLAYTYQFSPYGNKKVEVFSPGNNTKITSEKMPEWMTVDPLKRDKVTFIEEKEVKYNYPKRSYIQYIEMPPQKEKPWLLIVAIVLIILLKKYSK